MRDIYVFAGVMFALPYTFTRPFFGLLMFSWLAYMRPQDLCWGPARGVRFSLAVAACMFVGFVVNERRPFTRMTPQTKWMVLLWVWIALSIPFNDMIWPKYQVNKLLDLVKVFAVAFFTIGLTDSKKRLDMLLWTITLSLGFYGVMGGLFGVFTGGRILQGPGGMLKDNNDLCLAMNMVLPMIFYMGQASTKPRVRRGCLIATGLTMVTVIITTSRGGMLTLAGVLFLIVIKSNKKFIGLSVGTFALLMILLFMPADVKERLATLKDPTAESSAMGRLFAWGIAFDMAQDRPIFGVGFENFVPKFRRYAPRYLARDVKGVSSIRVTHNSYLQLLAEVGFPALFFFLAMILSTIFMMRRLRREVRARDGPRWVHFYAHMIEVSLLAFMGGAMFLNRSHFDLLYHVVALGGVVYLLGRKALRGDLVEEQEAPEKFPELRHVPSYPNLARP